MHHAKLIWDYLASHSDPAECDAIVVCCSYDLRVCDYACELVKRSLAPIVVFSGNTGNWTEHLWDIPEAEVFAERALANGVSETSILRELNATNIGENVAFSRKLLPEAETVTFVTKPNTILRVGLTAPVQWPGVRANLACPPFSFPDGVSNVIGLFGVINEIVGDIQRIMEYPQLGYQIQHELPADVIESWEYLVEAGFTLHTMESKKIK